MCTERARSTRGAGARRDEASELPTLLVQLPLQLFVPSMEIVLTFAPSAHDFVGVIGIHFRFRFRRSWLSILAAAAVGVGGVRHR